MISFQYKLLQNKNVNICIFQRVEDPNTFCISQRKFAIAIAIAGLILMIAVIIAILILVSKRRRKNLSTTGTEKYSTECSLVYSATGKAN